jgi:hypothetical protein
MKKSAMFTCLPNKTNITAHMSESMSCSCKVNIIEWLKQQIWIRMHFQFESKHTWRCPKQCNYEAVEPAIGVTMKWLQKHTWTGETMKCNLHGDENQPNRVCKTESGEGQGRRGLIVLYMTLVAQK